MKVNVTQAFLEDLAALPKTQAKSCRELIRGLNAVGAADLRTQALPGWRLHALQASDFVSLSLDMNYRVLATLGEGELVLHRAVSHQEADRLRVNRAGRATDVAEVLDQGLRAEDVYPSLRALGVTADEAAPFRDCRNDDDLTEALGVAAPNVASLALSLYEASSLVIPKSGFRLVANDEDLEVALTVGGLTWQRFLHPSQTLLVELPIDAQIAIAGSAGTGKTVAAWHRCRRLLEGGYGVGFVTPNPYVLDVSRAVLNAMPTTTGQGYFLVPPSPAALVQLGERVDALIIDEGQEIPWSWLRQLATATSRRALGIALFYDLNQLTGNIPRNDRRRYEERLENWGRTLDSLQLRRISLSVNFRNSRQIATHYLELLLNALPIRAAGELPAYEGADVVVRSLNVTDLVGVVASVLRRLLSSLQPADIGVALLSGGPRIKALQPDLARLGLPVADGVRADGISVAEGAAFRGHERRAMVVIGPARDRVTRNFGAAVEAYIAMSRAIETLVVLEVE